MQAHILIVGAGITGAALAWHLRHKARVTVIDAGPVAGGASGRSFGWINASFYLNPAHFNLRMAGMAAHGQVLRELDCPTRITGCIWYEEADIAPTATALRDMGYSVRDMTRADIAALIPALASPPEQALFFPDEGATDLAALTRRLLAASGAMVVAGCRVDGLLQDGPRVAGVMTGQGAIAADQVVLAAGCGINDLLAGVGLHLPLLSRPGAMVRTRPLPQVLPVILATVGQELRQDETGRILAPASAAHQSDSATRLHMPAAQMLADTLGRISTLFPDLDIAGEEIILAERPVPADGLPVIGPTGIDGLWLSVMHSGATLGLVAGERLAAQITGQDCPDLAPFAPARLLTAQ